MGTRHQPHSARSCELALRALGAVRGRPGGGPLAWVRGIRGRALSQPRPPVLWGVRPGPSTRWLRVLGVRAWGPVTNPTARALASWLCALWGRFEGARGGRFLPGCGASGIGRSPTSTACHLGRAARAHYALAVGAGGVGVRTRHQPHCARSCEVVWRAVGAARGHPGGAPLAWLRGVRGRALCHPPPVVLWSVRPGPATDWLWVRCAGGGARLSLAPPRVPRFVLCCAHFPGLRHPVVVVAWHLSSCRGCGRRRASLACVVARLWCAAPRPVRLLSVLWSAFLSPWCLPPPWGLSPQALLGGCAARGGWPSTTLFVRAAGPCQGRRAGRAPRRTRSWPRDGVDPGGSLRVRSWAACAAVVCRVWTRSLTRPVSRTVRLSTGDSAGAPELFRVDADTSHFGSEDVTPGSRACARARALLGRVGRAGPRARFGAPHIFLWPFLVPSLSARPPPGWGRPACGFS